MAANPELRAQVEQAIEQNPVLLFMKGTPEAPRCGFSMRIVGILEQVGVEYGAIDVLPVMQPLREVTAEISEWETFPQLYVNGELVGGCDIVEEMFESGEARRAARRRAARGRGRERRGPGPGRRGSVPVAADADREQLRPEGAGPGRHRGASGFGTGPRVHAGPRLL